MPTVRLDPSAEGTETAWLLAAGASKTAAVTWPDDDVTTCINSTEASTARQSFAMGNLPSEAIGVTAHTVRMRWIALTMPEGDETVNMYLNIGGVRTHGTAFGPDAAWTTRTQTALAGALTVAQVNGAELGVRDNGTNNDGTAGGNVLVSTLSWDVTYLASGGGLVFMIGALGPLVAIGLHELPAIARALYRKTGKLLLPDEYMAAWRALRAARHPRYFLLGAR